MTAEELAHEYAALMECGYSAALAFVQVMLTEHGETWLRQSLAEYRAFESEQFS